MQVEREDFHRLVFDIEDLIGTPNGPLTPSQGGEYGFDPR
jgi:hypothetical protein